MNSFFDTVPFLSLSINRNSLRTLASVIASICLLKANAAVDMAWTASHVATTERSLRAMLASYGMVIIFAVS
jgi:hypothetical protein